MPKTGKTQIVIMGMMPPMSSIVSKAIAEMVESKEIIFVTQEQGAEMAALLKKEPKENPFENPPLPYVISRMDTEPLSQIFLNENNPWPSPKGRKGKKRW